MNTIGYFEIQADDPPRLADFYHQLFGWRFSRDENVLVPYWRIETGGVRGGLLQRPANTPPMECGTNAYVCSIEVEEIDALSEKIIAQGDQIALPKFPVPGVCWHAYFIDIDGNTFGVFSQMKPPSNAGDYLADPASGVEGYTTNAALCGKFGA